MTGRRERGTAIYAQLFTVPECDVADAFAARVGPLFAGEALEAAGGDAGTNPALTGRERSIAIISALAAQGVSGDRLSTHLQVGQRDGLDEDSISALMTLLAVYVGYPRASLAMEAAHNWFASPRGATTPTHP